jgi:hypothetical protein
MSREAHVQFCESPAVRFPGATHRNIYVRSEQAGRRVMESITRFIHAQPPASLLCKLGSIIVQYEEMTSKHGHGFDKVAMDALIADAEVQDWIAEMQKLAMLPVKRNNANRK